MVLLLKILFSFFAAIGMIYLLRDAVVWLLFHKKTYKHTITVHITTLSFDEIASILRHYRHLLECPRAAALIGRIVLLFDPLDPNAYISRWEVENLLDCFDEPIELRTTKEYIHLIEKGNYFR